MSRVEARGDLSFHAPLSDAGAGVANIAPRVGSEVAGFVRATPGLTVLSSGLLASVASGSPRYAYRNVRRINLLKAGEAFDNVAWYADGVTVTPNVSEAPGGGTTMDLIVEGSGTNGAAGHKAYQQVLGTQPGTYRVSCYAKAGTRSVLTITNWATGGLTFADTNASFYDLTTGAVSGPHSPQMEQVESGIWRCSRTVTFGGTAGAAHVGIGPSDGTGVYVYSGNGTSGLYVWGAQLESGSALGSYIATPTTTTGFADSTIPGGYLCEKQSTNILPDSIAINSWSQGSTTTTAGGYGAPDGSTNACRVTSNVTGAASVAHAITLTAGTNPYTFSLYLKRGNVDTVELGLWDTAAAWRSFWSVNLATGVSSSAGTQLSGAGVMVEPAADGWWRVSVQCTSAAAGASYTLYVYPRVGGASQSGDQFYAWGGQMEAGFIPTSFIQTTTIPVQRNGDRLTYGITAMPLNTGTMAVTAQMNTPNGVSPEQYVIVCSGNGQAPLKVTSPTACSSLDGTTTVNRTMAGNAYTRPTTMAAAYGGATILLSDSGGAATSGAFDGAMGGVGGVAIGGVDDAGNFCGTLRDVRAWPTKFSDGALQVLTA